MDHDEHLVKTHEEQIRTLFQKTDEMNKSYNAILLEIAGLKGNMQAGFREASTSMDQVSEKLDALNLTIQCIREKADGAKEVADKALQQWRTSEWFLQMVNGMNRYAVIALLGVLAILGVMHWGGLGEFFKRKLQ